MTCSVCVHSRHPITARAVAYQAHLAQVDGMVGKKDSRFCQSFPLKFCWSSFCNLVLVKALSFSQPTPILTPNPSNKRWHRSSYTPHPSQHSSFFCLRSSVPTVWAQLLSINNNRDSEGKLKLLQSSSANQPSPAWRTAVEISPNSVDSHNFSWPLSCRGDILSQTRRKVA